MTEQQVETTLRDLATEAVLKCGDLDKAERHLRMLYRALPDDQRAEIDEQIRHKAFRVAIGEASAYQQAVVRRQFSLPPSKRTGAMDADALKVVSAVQKSVMNKSILDAWLVNGKPLAMCYGAEIDPEIARQRSTKANAGQRERFLMFVRERTGDHELVGDKVQCSDAETTWRRLSRT